MLGGLLRAKAITQEKVATVFGMGFVQMVIETFSLL